MMVAIWPVQESLIVGAVNILRVRHLVFVGAYRHAYC